MSHAVVIFARSPLGEARAKGLPPRTGAPLFRALLLAWISAARRAGATPIIASTTADRGPLMAIAPDCDWIEQRGDRFGDRLASAASAVFARGYQPVLIGGIDTPPPLDLGRAFELLDRGETRAVIAPARDGGVNLIGLAVPASRFLRTLCPGSHDVVGRFRRRFPDLIAMPVQSDIDSPADLAAALLEPQWLAFRPLLLGCVPQDGFTIPIARRTRHAVAVRIPRAPPAG